MDRGSKVRASALLAALGVIGAISVSGRAAPESSSPSKPSSASAAAPEPAIQPQAREALVRMEAYFKSLPGFRVHEDVTREQVINGDLKVQKTSTADILVRRPDGLRADVIGDDDKSHEIFFDGTKLTVYMPTKKYYVQMDAPGTLAAALDEASRYGVEFPTADFLRMASGEDFTKSVTAAGDVGPSRIAGADCEHYTYRTADVDYQLWIQNGETPLPRKLVITSKRQATQPEYAAVLAWDVAPAIAGAAFSFVPPTGAAKIALRAPLAPTNAKSQPTQQK
jgi:hypothetical protein